jgi:hypothetical protein
MKCKRCEIEIDGSYGSGIFCSKSCASSRGPRTEKFKRTVSQKLTGRKSKNNGYTTGTLKAKPDIVKVCPTCSNEFTIRPWEKKSHCSKKCNPKIGGYRERSGRAKSGYYKGIYCGSSYELVWVIFMLDHNLPFKRFNGQLKNDEITYVPDFIIDDTIIELKGYEDSVTVNKKVKLAESSGYNIKVLYREDLEAEFKWVKDQYKFTYVWELYDDYKPKHIYICNNCKQEFATERKRNTSKVYCSQKCAGASKKKHSAL